MRYKRKALALAAMAAMTLSGCGAGSVPEEEVEKTAAEQLAKAVNQPEPDIECPGGLEAEVGTSMRCELTAGTDKLGVTVTVTAVDGSDVKFDVQVDDAPQG